MKKRIALAAAIALAISVGGMLPASAAKLTAPTLTGPSDCVRAGGTLEIRGVSESVKVQRESLTLLKVTVGTNGSICTDEEEALLGLEKVLIKSTGTSVTIDLESYTPDTPADFGSIPMEIRTTGELVFDGSGISGTSYRPISGTVTEESFTLGTVTGSYYATLLRFLGTAGGDTFDASAVTTTPVNADGNAGGDTLKGGALADTIVGDLGDDTIYGGAGDDPSLAGDAGNDKVFGEAGDDTINVADGGTCTDERYLPGVGNQGRDPVCQAYSASGVDQGWGGAGNDGIAADGADTVAPGDGFDTITGAVGVLTYVDSTASITLNLDLYPNVVKSSTGDDVFPAGEVAAFVGSALADIMVGTDGADTDTTGDGLYGGSGADKIVGLGGPDVLAGNGGKDVIKGGTENDEIYGDSGADLINGGGGNDAVYGGGGDDIMYGSAGDDVLRGEKGTDQSWGGKGTFDVCAAEVTDSCEFKK